MTSCDDVSYPSAYLEAVRPENRLADPNTELTSICYPVFEGDQNRNLTRPTKNGDPRSLSQFVCNDDNEGIPAVNQERGTTDVVERIVIASGVDSIKAVPYRSIDGQISDDSTKSHPFSSSEHCPMTEECDSVGSSDDGDEQRKISFDLELQSNFSQVNDNFVPAISDDCHPNLGLNNLILLNGKRDTDSNSLLVDIDANHKEISYLENGILEAYDNFDDTEYDLAFIDDSSDTLDLPVLLKQDLVSLQEGLFGRGELDIVLSDDAQEQQLLETRNRAREAAFTAELEQRGQHRSLYATYGDLSQLAIDSHENGTDDDEDELICRAHQLAALHSNSSTISTAHPSNSRALQSILLAGNEIHAYVGSDRRRQNQHAVLTKSRSLDDPFCDNSGIRISPLNSTQRGVILVESSNDEQVVDEKGVDKVSNPSVSCKDTNENIETNMATVEPDIKEENVEPKVEKDSESNLKENAGNNMEAENENTSESAKNKVDIKCYDDAVIDENTPSSADNVDQCDEETKEEQQSLRIDINTQISNMDDRHQLMSNQLIEFADNKSIKENESFMKFLEELRSHLACSRSLMNDLVEVNSNLERKNIETAQELEEAQDRFREGDVNDFRDLQKELEQASRNCRIMQFKLRKAEKKLEEDALGKSDGNGKSKPKTPDLPDGDPTKDKIRDLNQQLAVAKDVSVRLHQELEMIEDKRTKLDEENQLYRKRLEDSDSTKQQLKRDLEKMRTEV
ncbi:myosin-10-like isoform X2 [Anneissia japonica]|uniref:myosin-10-like isoform X2 n=1 Tax=Anneissia japonica TaxID=1529436 RepID=UPI0014258840|nr:myosin-10-like isoform X2 [Anneissia japonica]